LLVAGSRFAPFDGAMALRLKNRVVTYQVLSTILTAGVVFSQATLACPDGAFKALAFQSQGPLGIDLTPLQRGALELEQRINDGLSSGNPDPGKAHFALVARHLISYARKYERVPDPWTLWEQYRPMGVQPLAERVNFAPYTPEEITWLSNNFYSAPQSNVSQPKGNDKKKARLEDKRARAQAREVKKRRREEQGELGNAAGDAQDSSLALLRKAVLRPIEVDAQLIELLRQERKKGTRIDERHFEELAAALLGKCFELHESGFFIEPVFSSADRRAFAPTLERAVLKKGTHLLFGRISAGYVLPTYAAGKWMGTCTL
jgi:hypothetical protein